MTSTRNWAGWAITIAVLVCLAFSAAPERTIAQGAASASEKGRPIPGRYIVVLNSSVDKPGAVARADTDRVNGSVQFVYRNALKGYSATLSASAAQALAKDPHVAYIEPDVRVGTTAQTIPTGIRRTFATDSAPLGINGIDDFRPDVDVAVLDTGIDYQHTDLNVVGRTDCSNGATRANECIDGSGTDDHSHGTHVAGTIAAIDNGVGVTGMAPGARLWAVKVFDSSGRGPLSEYIAGLDWVTAQAGVIEVANSSLSGAGSSQAFTEAMSASIATGVVHVASAGNENEDAVGYYPANHPDVITVSAIADYDGRAGAEASSTCDTALDDRKASFSNYGSIVDIAAPGVCINSTLPGNLYGDKSGTSMAAPHVSGAAALLAAHSNPNSQSDVTAIRNALVNEGNLGWTDTSGDGVQEPLLDAKDLPGVTVPTTTRLTLDGWLNGQPGYASVHGTVTWYGGMPAQGYVNVNFQKFVNGNWQTEISAHPTLSNGYFEVNNQSGLGVGLWRVRAVFPSGQSPYIYSESEYRDFEIKHGYQIVARHSGKCLDVSERRTTNGQLIHQWDCQDTNTHQNQVFSLVPQNTGGLQIVARHSGRCVDVTGVSHTAGTALQQYDCLGANQSNQLWWRDQIAPGSPYFTFRAKHSGQCMDVQGVGTGNGAPVTQYPCIGGQQNQQWDLRPVNSGPILTQAYLSVEQTLHGQPGYVSVWGNVQRSPVPGSGIPMTTGYVNVNFQKLVNGNWQTMSTAQRTLDSNGGYSVQHWGVGVGEWRVRAVFPEGQSNFAQSESGYHTFTIRPGYHLVNRYSDKCMSLSGNNGANGTAIIQWACSSNPSPGDGQVMHRVPIAGGWQLKINSTGKCVDVTNVSQANGAWLQQWDCLGAGQANQIWNVIPIAGQAPWLAFRAVHSQKCADNTGPSRNNGVRIQQWDCHWGGGQQWDMRPVG